MGQRSSTPTVFPFPQGQPAAGSDCRASELLGNYDFQDCPPAGNGLLSPAKKKLAKSAKTPRDPDAEGDPLTLTGNIGHFGVGAQHSVFFMGNMEHVISRAAGATGKKPVEDMVISGKEMHTKWEKGDRTTVYKYPIHPRALGDTTLLHQMDSEEAQKQLQATAGHRFLKELIDSETRDDADAHFSMFVVSGLHGDHQAKFGRRPHGRVESDMGLGDTLQEVVEDVARIYNYYLHGTEDKAIDQSDSESSDGEDEDSDDDDDDQGRAGRAKSSQSGGSTKRKGGKLSAASNGKRAKPAGGGAKGCEALLRNIDMEFTFQGMSGPFKDPISLGDERNNIEYRMRRKAMSSFSFNLVAPNISAKSKPHKVTVRLYYFPKLIDRETRPLDRYEEKIREASADQPIINCYWEGRWIPYAHVTSFKKIFEQIQGSIDTRHLLGRVRGSVFFPHSFLPSNNKLSFQQSPQELLNKDDVRIMKQGRWDEDAERGVRTDFTKWIKDCHEKYDMDVMLTMLGTKKPEYNDAEKCTMYDKLTYGHVDYEVNQKVIISKGKPHLYGEIVKIGRPGKIGEDFKEDSKSTSEGFIWIKRYPLEVFGDGDKNSTKIPVVRLDCDKKTREDVNSMEDKWQSRVDELRDILPYEIMVTEGRAEGQDAMLEQGKLRAQPKTRENSKEVQNNTERELLAGDKVPRYDVSILNKVGKPVKDDVMQSTKFSDPERSRQNKKLSVQITVRRTSAEEPDLFGLIGIKIFPDGSALIHEETQSRQSKDLCFSFQYVGECFSIAGSYQLTFKVIGAELYDTESKTFKPIEWNQNFKIAPGPPHCAEIAQGEGVGAPVLSLGCEKPGAIRCCFRDEQEEFVRDIPGGRGSKGKSKSVESSQATKGNLCQIPRKLQLGFEDVKPVGFELNAEACSGEDAKKLADDRKISTFNVQITPTSKDVEALNDLRKKAGQQLQGECTLVFRYKAGKRKSGKEDAEEKKIFMEKFKFLIEAGEPHELRFCTATQQAVSDKVLKKLNMAIENRSTLSQVDVQVVDFWGCPVSKFRGEGLKIVEQLVYSGEEQNIKRRKEAKKSLDKLVHDVVESKGMATVGHRRIVLRDPPVSDPESHTLEIKLLRQDGVTPLSKTIKIKNDPLTLSVNIKPSKFPQEVRVWVGNTMIPPPKDGEPEHPIETTAGTKQGLVKFQFLDEAGRPVSVTQKDGWTVEGGGWGKKKVACVCENGFVAMPPGIEARERTGDLSEHTIIFYGPEEESGFPACIKVNISLVPIAAKPCQWVVCAIAGPTANTVRAKEKSPAKTPAVDQKMMKACEPTKPVIIKSGQALCEILCVRLTDKFHNMVPLNIYAAELQPQALMISGGSSLLKEGDWKSPLEYDADTDSFLFKQGSCLVGQRNTGKIELRITTHASASSEAWKGNKVTQHMQALQLAAGDPHRVRLSFSGFPGASPRYDEKAREQGQGAQKAKTLSTEVDGTPFEAWPAVCRIDEICMEVVDKAGNLVDNANLQDATANFFTLALRGGELVHSSKPQVVPSSAEEARELGPIKLDKAELYKKLKRVLVKGEPGRPAVIEASVNLSGFSDIQKATAEIRFRQANLVDNIECGTDEAIPEFATPGERISLRARVNTHDLQGLDKDVLLKSLVCELALESPYHRKKLTGKIEYERVDICEHNQFRSECQLCLGTVDDDPADAWVRWVVDPKDMRQAGQYTLAVTFTERRPEMKELLEKFALTAVPEQKFSFSVLPGAAWHLSIEECKTQAAAHHVPSVSNMENESVIVHRITVQLKDAYHNPIDSPRGGLKVVAYLAALRSQRECHELCAELDFTFVNNAERRKQIGELQHRIQQQQDESRQCKTRIEESRKRVEEFESGARNAREALKSAASHCKRIRAVPEERLHLLDNFEQQDLQAVEEMLKQVDDRMSLQSASGRQGSEVPRSAADFVRRCQAQYGADKVYGMIGQLISVEDPNVSRLLSAFNQKTLKLLVVADCETQNKISLSYSPLEIISEEMTNVDAYRDQRIYKNRQGKDRIEWPSKRHIRDPAVQRQYEDMSEKMVINQIEFHKEEHEKLRFTVVWSMIGAAVVEDLSLGGMMMQKRRMTAQRINVGEMWSKIDFQRMDSRGITGSRNNIARTTEEMRRGIRDDHQSATILLPRPNDCAAKKDAIKDCSAALSEYRKKVSHLNEIKKKGYMHDAIKKDNEKLDELGSSIEKDKKKLFFLQQPASQDSGAGGSAGGLPPQLKGTQPLDPGHVLRTEYGSLGDAMLVDLNEKGCASIERIMLQPDVGTQESRFTLRFVVVDPVHLAPIQRGAEDAGLRDCRVLPDCWTPIGP